MPFKESIRQSHGAYRRTWKAATWMAAQCKESGDSIAESTRVGAVYVTTESVQDDRSPLPPLAIGPQGSY